MTKFIVTLVLALLPTLFYAQSAFDKFEGREDITSVSVNKKTFEMLGEMKVDAKDSKDKKGNKDIAKYLGMADKIDNVKVFTTSSIKATAELKSTFESYRKKENLEQLMKVNDGGKNVQIYVKSGKTSSEAKEFLIFVEGGDKIGDETVLVSLVGDIDLKDIMNK